MLRDVIKFEIVPPPADSGNRSVVPFTIALSSSTSDAHVIDLYSQFSRSAPYYGARSKWEHLLPRWRFLDEDNNVINNITTTDTSVYENGTFIGVTGTADFYYVDDLGTFPNNPVVIWATLQTSGIPVSYDNEKQAVPGFANSKALAATPFYINTQVPTYLKITRNGIDPIPMLKWTTVPFNYVITVHSDSFSCDPLAETEPIIFDYPESNVIGLSAGPINRTIAGIPSAYLDFSPETDYFQTLDSDGFNIGGFRLGNVTSSLSSTSTYLSASVSLIYDVPIRKLPYAWIGNSANRKINRVEFFTQLPDSYMELLLPIPRLQPLSAIMNSYDAPYITEFDLTDTTQFSGYGGIFGIAVTKCYDVWATDGEMDQIFKFNSQGQLLSTIDLTDGVLFATGDKVTPAGITLDSNNDFWVTTYDTISALKFDSNGNFLFSISPSGILSASEFDNPLIQPTLIETDTQDDVWVSFTSNICSMLYKYSSSGTEIFQVTLDSVSSMPVDMFVDGSDNGVWIANANSYVESYGKIQKYSSAGVQLSSYDFPSPNFITLDPNRTVWFIYGYNNVGYITNAGTSGSFSLCGININTPTAVIPGVDTVMGGIACDSENRVLILNSETNFLYMLSAGSTDFSQISSTMQIVHILPDNNQSWYYDAVSGYQTFTDPDVKAIQAYGDWTGYKWQQKYYPFNDTVTNVITGISNEFRIDEFQEDLTIRKFNESWDTSNQMRAYALPENINDKINTFNTYLSSMIGGVSPTEDSIGRKSYEKIANFVPNNADIEESEITQLYSLAKEVNIPLEDYDFDFPPKLRRLMNLFSISHGNLWGTRCKCRTNFFINKPVCTVCNHNHCLNRSRSPIDINTYQISGGEKVVIRPIYGKEYYDVLETSTTIISGGSSVNVYPIAAAPSIAWLTSPYYEEYYFYKYIPEFCDTQVEGVINWDDQYTTISENNSALSDWYDRDQIIETMLSYVLHEKLDMGT